MRILFYDNKELIVPDSLEPLIQNFYNRIFKISREESKIAGSSLVDFLNKDYNEDQKNKLIQDFYKNAVNICVDINPDNKELQELTPIQRLYLYQTKAKQKRIEVILNPLSIRYQVIPSSLKQVIPSNENKEYFIAEVAESDDMSSLLYISLIKMVTNNIYVKKCEYCGKYFLIQGRRKTVKYCDNIPEGKTQPCFALAARQKYEQKLENDSITRAYRSAYKKYNQRVRIGKWDNRDFEKWTTEAKAKLKQAQNNKITEEDFIKWLKGDE